MKKPMKEVEPEQVVLSPSILALAKTLDLDEEEAVGLVDFEAAKAVNVEVFGANANAETFFAVLERLSENLAADLKSSAKVAAEAFESSDPETIFEVYDRTYAYNNPKVAIDQLFKSIRLAREYPGAITPEVVFATFDAMFKEDEEDEGK